MDTLQALLEKVESYEFECEGGPLTGCVQWQELRALPALRAAPVAEREVDSFGRDLREQNLAMMMQRMAARLKSLDHGASMAGQALELLERMDLQGSPLRAPEPLAAPGHDTPSGAEAVDDPDDAAALARLADQFNRLWDEIRLTIVRLAAQPAAQQPEGKG